MGGIKSKENTNGRTDAEGKDDGTGENHGLEIGEDSHKPRGGDPAQHADQSAQQAQDDGFDQELQPDVAGLRANGDADADFAGAFGDAAERNSMFNFVIVIRGSIYFQPPPSAV